MCLANIPGSFRFSFPNAALYTYVYIYMIPASFKDIDVYPFKPKSLQYFESTVAMSPSYNESTRGRLTKVPDLLIG